MLVVRGINNDQNDRTYKVQRPLIVGRSRNCDVFIADVRASRQQARFYRDPDGYLMVEDLNSLNGTFLNGRQVTRHRLKEGDIVRLGSTDFEVHSIERKSTVEVIDPSFEQSTKIIKQVSTIEMPSLGTMQTQDYLRAIGVTEDISGDSKSAIIALQQKTKNFATLFEISSMVSEAEDPDELLKSILDVLLKVPGGDFAYVALLENNELIPRVSRSTSGALERFVLSRSVSKFVLDEQCAVLAPDLRNDVRFSSSESIIVGPTGSIMAVPMIKDHKVRGIIALCTAEIRHKAEEEDLDLLCVIAGMVGSALENLELSAQRERNLKELEDANRKILETQEQLIRTERMAAIGRLSSGVIHEVKNHLSPLMLADLVAEQYPEDEDIQEMTEMVIEARRRILDLVDEIRMFARGDSRSYNMQPHSIDVLCSKVVRFVRCDAKVRRVRLEYSCTTDVMMIIDADRIRQVLINLIQNAADAIDGKEQPKVYVVVEQQGTSIVISITDNGVGIPEEIQRKIFDPMFTTKGENGLGLGLDICRRIVIAHSGKLVCESTVGEGTTFKVCLPLHLPNDFVTEI
jgi:two-component system, NtrC family, sensor kinase